MVDCPVTIIIPVRNRRELITRCLDSVPAQTWRSLRIIVVDNGSSDGTGDAVLRWVSENGVRLEGDCSAVGGNSVTKPGRTLLLLKEDKPGASAARNRAVDEIVGEHVIFFDSDDEMMPTLVEEAMNAIGDADLVYWQGEVVGLDGGVTLKPFHTGNLLRRQFYNGMLATQLYMLSTRFLRNKLKNDGSSGEETPLWEERASVWNDWELGIRIALARPKVVALPKKLVRIHAQAESITGRRFSDREGEWENTLDIVEKKIQGLPEESRLLDMVDYRSAILAAHYDREGNHPGAKALLSRALSRAGRPSWRRLLLRLLYRYTASGGRGAYYLWR